MGVNQNIRQSGKAVVPPDGSLVNILAHGKGLPEDEAEGVGGLALIQVDVSDFTSTQHPAPAAIVDYQQRLILIVSWSVGLSMHSAFVDASQSTTFTVAACDSIGLQAQMWAIDTDGVAPVAAVRGFAYEVSVNVSWKSGATPVQAYMTGAAVTLEGIAAGPIQRIPKYARGGMVKTTVPASSPGLFARFFTSDIAAGPVVHSRVDNPYLNGFAIVSGERFVQLDSPVAMRCIPTYDLFL